MLKATYYKPKPSRSKTSRSKTSRSKNSKRRGWDPTLVLVVIIGFCVLGYLYLSAHGPILIHLW